MTLFAALALQAVSLVLLRQQLFGTWLRRPFAVMVIIAVFYHGVSEVLRLLPNGAVASMYRRGIVDQDAHLAALIISVSILSATTAYLVGLGHSGRHATTDAGKLRAAMRTLDWRLLTIALIPLAVTTYNGQGYSSGVVLNSLEQPPLQVLASSLFVVLVILTTFSIVVRFGRKCFVPAVLGQALIMAACGQRLEIVLSAFVVLMLLNMVDLSPSKKQVLAIMAVGVFLMSSITALRIDGREIFYTDTSFEERIAVVGTALFNPPKTTGTIYQRPLLAQLTERLDGNEFSAPVLTALESRPPMGGLGEVINSMSPAVPSFLNPNKFNGDLGSRSSEGAQIEYFNLLRVDHLPGHFSLWLGLVGAWLHVPLMALFGLIFARFERWTMNKATAARIVIFTLLAIGALFYERGIPSMLIFLRYGLVIGPLLFLVQNAMRSKNDAVAPSTVSAAASRITPMLR